jgi:hypothetical protein
MKPHDVIQDLAEDIYQGPLSGIRDEPDYPDLSNPLHVVVLLIDCDTEIDMNGMLGFLENMTGQHLAKTTEALEMIGAPKCAVLFQLVHETMDRHGVTWQHLRGAFRGAKEFQITSFHALHGEAFNQFANQVCELTKGFSLLNTLYSPEDVYGALCAYLEDKVERLSDEVKKRRA